MIYITEGNGRIHAFPEEYRTVIENRVRNTLDGLREATPQEVADYLSAGERGRTAALKV